MANAPSFFHNFSTPSHSLKHPNSCNKQVIFNPKKQIHKRSSSLPPLASSLALPINVDYLKREFSSHGLSFEGIGDSCVVKMRLEIGSAASLMLPSGLITSYKPFMWHGGTVEVLHTTVTEGENDQVVIRGGVSMDLSCIGDSGFSWSSNKWVLLDVRGSSEKSIQVELVSIGRRDMVEAKCLVTLQQDFIGSEIIITNQRSSCLQLSGSIMSHLTVSTPDATYAVGLQGSSYQRKQPMVSHFSIIPPEFMDENILIDEEVEEEDDDYAQMTEKSSRIYSDAPKELTIIDRGRRNSVVVRRSGFNEMYILSPGSDYEWYGKYAYICVGPSAMLKPIILGPEAVWTGAQYLYNPNL